ncbi:MAG: CaiB/BaiF CoA transferase family protein, partial [Candidatus Kariarchaeaceae archaeon]
MLSKLKIMDFTSLLPGPYATMMLADLGADILKIEAPQRVDLVNEFGPKFGSYSALYHTLNRNKKIIQLDLKNNEDVDKVHKLLNEYNVVIEGFRPGVMQRLGLDYQTLSKTNDKLIYCSLTGYGQSGPMANQAGHDINYLALSGIPSFSGHASSGPGLNGIQIADIAGGSLHVVIGVLCAFIHRERTGRGQYIDVAMYDTTFSLSIFETIGFLATGKVPQSGEGILNGGGIYDYYKTQDGKYLSIGSLEPKFQIQLFQILDINIENKSVDEIKRLIQKIIESKPLEFWIDTFSQYDVCVEPVLELNEVVKHPQFVSRNLIGSLEI